MINRGSFGLQTSRNVELHFAMFRLHVLPFILLVAGVDVKDKKWKEQ